MNPDDGMLRFGLAMAQAGLGREDEALESGRIARSMMPSNNFTFSILRDVALRVGRADIVEMVTRRLCAITRFEAFHQTGGGAWLAPSQGSFS